MRTVFLAFFTGMLACIGIFASLATDYVDIGHGLHPAAALGGAVICACLAALCLDCAEQV
jgi:hypothetical protein